MFIRAKTVKGKKYGYLVENTWKKGKVKQKVKKYLGRIISLEDTEPSFLDIDFSSPQKECIQLLIEQEFLAKNFEKKKASLYKDQIKINVKQGKITQDDNNIVLFMNGRYVYGSLLKDLINFYEPEAEEDTKGEKLAKAFSDAGIHISPEQFVQLYQKLYLPAS